MVAPENGKNDGKKQKESFGELNHNPDHERPLKAWARDVAIRQECHRELALKYSRRGKILNAISVFLSAFSSSAIFASFKKQEAVEDNIFLSNLHVIGGVVAAFSTFMQSLQQSLEYAEYAERNMTACKQFTKLRFRLEVIAGNNLVDDGKLVMARLTDWTREYQDLLESSPLIDLSIIDRHTKGYKQRMIAQGKDFDVQEPVIAKAELKVGIKEE